MTMSGQPTLLVSVIGSLNSTSEVMVVDFAITTWYAPGVVTNAWFVESDWAGSHTELSFQKELLMAGFENRT